MNSTLITDLYELSMGEKNFQEGMIEEKQYYDVTFRKNPFGGGYTIAAGLDNVIKHIKALRFTQEELAYLKSLDLFSEEFLAYLKQFRFTGDIKAVPDGTVVFPNEPLLTILANALEAKLLEGAILSYYNHGSLVATKARRIVDAAKVPVMEFGLRRALGVESGIEGAKYAYLGGCIGTSNIESGFRYQIPVKGTMAHCAIMEADSEYEAFLNYAKANPNNCVFLVDTYHTLKSGVPNAIRVADEFLTPNGYPFKGIRIDSGDLAYTSKEARKMLDEAGYPDAQICLSNGLNEEMLESLALSGAKYDSIGAGDNIIHPLDRLGCIYKLTAIERNGALIPKMKFSDEVPKATIPGVKQVVRFYEKETGYALGDVLALQEEVIPSSHYTLVDHNALWKQTTLTNYTARSLQVPIFEQGILVYTEPTLEEKRRYCEEEMNHLYPELRRVRQAAPYYVDLSEELRCLREQLLFENQQHCDQMEQAYQKKLEKRNRHEI